MGVEGLFKDAPVLRWTEDWKKQRATAEGPRGISARVWLSAVSNKWVLTVDMPGGITRSRRVSGFEEARDLAEKWLREEGHA
ncbi:hypothetical protein [Xanthobacter autotrophicus]|uniref:hypothetical protein n=1 Tax=Xanthobacter autotrophicus TaxID=280 RepID=UPI00372A506E